MNNRDTELIWEAYNSNSKLKFGDIIPAISILDSLNFDISQFSKAGGSSVEHYFDPTSGGGGDQGDTLYDEKISELARKASVSKYYILTFFDSWIHNLFIPKCKKLADIALSPDMTKPRKEMSPEEVEAFKEARSRGYAVEMFPYIGIASSPESYRLLVGEAWDQLPDCVIGNTEWDYSFHAGEGKVDSFIAAIGGSEQEVKTLLVQALKSINAEYVGSSTEAKFRQRYQVREGD